MYFGSARFLRISSSVAELSRCGQPGQKVGVRAIDLVVEDLQSGFAGLADAGQLGAEPAIAHFGGDFCRLP